MLPSFVHLHLHTDHSLIDGLCRIKPLIAQAVKLDMPALAMTDQGNLFATIKFYQACQAAGIKPIIGCDIWLENESDPDQPHSMVLLCQNQQGYHHLTCLVSQAYTEGQHHGKAIIQTKWLENAAQGLIALSGGANSDIHKLIVAGHIEEAQARIEFWQQQFADRYYLEIIRTGREGESQVNQQLLRLAQQLTVPIVASNDVRYLTKNDNEAHEARVCISSGQILSDPKRPRLYSAQQYLRSQQEMETLFADIPQALENSVEIAKRCNLSLSFGQYFLPNFPTPQGLTIADYFTQQSQEGLEQRLLSLYDKEKIAEIRHAYDQRLEMELATINKMGYAGYFLIVADFIGWSKQNGIPVGPGRGSGAGSLVAYVLGITDLDPLKYDLLFERFLNPERVSMPDFDVDFCMDGRDSVIDYVANRYGRESVSQIITYGTMAAKAALRDVGRVLGHPYGFVDALAKLVPFEIGMTLDKALAEEEMLMQRYQEEEEVRGLIDLARALEGTVRNAGKHAGGVVIAPSKLTDFTPLYCEEGSQAIVSQFDKDDVEAVGLVKFDFLGLRTLTIINWAVETINQKKNQHHQALIDITKIATDDAKTFELLKSCQTTAVFQLESRGMKDLIKRLQPDCFEDIIALVALFRPGPLQSGMVDDFIHRKHGLAEVEYFHDDLRNILSTTYGVILYQEQVMQIAQTLASYTLGGADLLRRAMGKKKVEEMAQQRKIFTQGAKARGIDESLATHIFDLMEKFAGYGFNKSHSAAYALVAYQTAWLKAHYPAEFMAAVLSSDMDSTDKVVIFVEECRRLGLTVLPPQLNRGYYKFTVNDNGDIVYGLGAIKGVGESVIEMIVNIRQNQGDFKDLFSFCCAVDIKKINRRVLEALIRSGACDDFQQSRANLLASLPKALKLAEQQAKEQYSGQSSLFGNVPLTGQGTEYVTVAPWPLEICLTGEKETLGLYFSGHPMQQYQLELSHFISANIGELSVNADKTVVIAGLITNMRTMMTKRGDRMAFVTLEDSTGRLETAVFSDLFHDKRELLTKDSIIVIEGELTLDDYSGGLRMRSQNILTMAQARLAYGNAIQLSLHEEQLNHDSLEKLYQLLKSYSKGTLPVRFAYQNKHVKAILQAAKDWSIHPHDNLLKQLKALLGEDNILIEY